MITMLKCSPITRVLELMGQVLEDGRSAVRGMRLSKERMQNPDLAFSRIPQELAVQASAGFRVIVEGTPRSMHPARFAMRSTALAGKPLPMHSVIHAQQESKFSLNTVSANCGCWCETMVVGLIHKRWTSAGRVSGGFRVCANGRKELGRS